MSSDIPIGLNFVDPTETEDTYRVVLWAAPGQGKSVAAASAPGPILVLSDDRPGAYKFARKHHTGKDLREVRWQSTASLEAVYRYLSEPDCDIRTLVVDPVSNVIDHIRDEAPASRDGGPDHQWVNKKFFGFIKELRRFDINVVLVAHEKLNDGKGGDNKLYPAMGGATLINKLLAEMDIVAHIERHVSGDEDSDVKWIGQLQPRDNLVCKEATGALGDRRIADLSRWFELASEALALEPAQDPLPFDAEPTQAELDAVAAAEEAIARAEAA